MKSLASRISLLAVAVAVITALLAGLLAVNLIKRTTDDNARSTLRQLANVAQSTANAGVNPTAAQSRAREQLRVLKINTAAIDTHGSIDTSASLLRRVLTKADVSAVLSGRSVSAQRRVGGQLVLLEARPTNAGGIALAQRRADATAVGDQAVRRIIWALLIAVVIAVLLGLAVAVRISRPLKRTAAAANALAAGHRDVAVPPQGPAEVVEVGSAVNTLAAALSHSEARQREFLLSVSHDLRTPLTAITGYAESLADGVVPPAEAAGVGAIMLTEAQRLNRLVADLLDLARLGSQEFRIEWAQVDLTELVYAAGQVWADRCRRAGVAFTIQADPVPLLLRTDAARVRQVIDGLLENALRVTPAGAPIVLAAFALEPAQVVVEVRDGGPGLADEDLAVAFQRSVLYERYRGIRQVGTGLGLAIVDGLVHRLGGTIEAGHAPEGGARFTVRFNPAPAGP